MWRPKWLSGWGKGKNLLEASLMIDIPDIKVVEANFNRKLVLFAVGTLPRAGDAAAESESKNPVLSVESFKDSSDS